MKSFKKAMSILLATIITFTAVFACTTTAFAAETTSEKSTIIELDVDPDINNNPRSTVTTFFFTFADTYTDIDRYYDTTYLRIGFNICEASTGLGVGDEVAISLKDYYDDEDILFVDADAGWHNFQIPIYTGIAYYLEFENLTSSTRILKVKVMITE